MRAPVVVSASVTFFLGIAVGLAGCVGDILDPGAGDDDDGVSLPVDAGPEGPNDRDAAATDRDAAPEPSALASGIHIREVTLYQGVGIALVDGGDPVESRNGPIVAGADAMFAIGYDVDPGFTPRAIEARVILDGGAPHVDLLDVSSSSPEGPSGVFQIRVPGAAIAAGARFRVELAEYGDPVPGVTDGARYPASGSAELGVESSNGPLELVLVPFRYNADGSGRLPPLDADAIAGYRHAFTAMYPVPDVDVTVRAPVDLGYSISSGNSWSRWLDDLVSVRQADGPASNVYYYGVAAPAASFGQFCGGGCIVGLGNVPGAQNSFLFASVGVSFAGSLNLPTSLHEVGHTMGRPHAPCGGPSGVDPSYPYAGASIGVWGYDAIADRLKDPGEYTDIMGYCQTQWISDYQYDHIFSRLRSVNGSAAAVAGEPQLYRVGLVDGAGHVTWTRTTTLRRAPVGGETAVALTDAAGASLGVAQGHFFPYDHLDGGTLWVPITAGSRVLEAADAAVSAGRGLSR